MPENSSTNAPRREFLKSAVGAGALVALGAAGRSLAGTTTTAVVPPVDLIPMPPLPYATAALAPYISERTVQLHYTGHHMKYYKTLMAYVNGHTEYQGRTLDQLVMDTKGGVLIDQGVFTVAVLLWNHNLYWKSMKPQGGVVPRRRSAFSEAVERSFGSFDKLKQKIAEVSQTIGIGWVWLAKTNGTLEVLWTDYQNSPFIEGRKPLLALDVWEHAYYLDYQNQRDKYVAAWLEHLVNWEFAEANFA